MIWKRFENGAEQDKENVPLTEEELGQSAEGVDAGKGEQSPKKAVKKICLAGGEGVANVWERRGSGLMREYDRGVARGHQAKMCADKVPQYPVGVEAQSHRQESNTTESTAVAGEILTKASDGAETTDTTASDTTLDTSIAVEEDADSSEASAPAPSLVATQVWTRSRAGLRDETASARAEATTPSRKAKLCKPSLSPGTELDEITPLFLKRMFTLLNDAMVASPQRSARKSLTPIRRSPTKTSAPIETETSTVARSPTKSTPVQATMSTEEEDKGEEMDVQHESLVDVEDAVVALEEMLDVQLEDDVPIQDLLEEALDREDEACAIPLDDDKKMLLDFLSRAEASKAKRAASMRRRSSLSYKLDSNAIKAALASPQKPNYDADAEAPDSPVKTGAGPVSDVAIETPLSSLEDVPMLDRVVTDAITPSTVESEADQPEAVEPDAKRTRRSTRLPKQAKNTPSETPNAITIFRTDGQELRVVKDAEARALATTTRANTRRNKGGAVRVLEMLLKLKSIVNEEIQAEVEAEKPGRIRWKEELAQYREIAAREEGADTDSAPPEDAPESDTTTAQDPVDTPRPKAIPRPRRAARPPIRRMKTTPEATPKKVREDSPEQAVTVSAPIPTTVATIPVVTPVTPTPSTTTIAVSAPAPVSRSRRLPQPVRARGKTAITATATTSNAAKTEDGTAGGLVEPRSIPETKSTAKAKAGIESTPAPTASASTGTNGTSIRPIRRTKSR